MRGHAVALVAAVIGRRLVDQLDDLLEHAGVGLGQHAVAEVEDVAGVAAVVGEHVAHLGRRRPATPARHERRVEVALHADVGAEPARGRRRVGTRQSTPTTSAPAARISAEQLAGADAEVDAGHAEVGQPGEDPSRCAGST